MPAVLGVREDRTYKTPALNSAKERAKEHWAKARKFGPIALDIETQARLNEEKKSVGKVFPIIATFALSGASFYSRSDGTVIIEEGGGRRWDQRSLAVAAQVSVTTLREALKRLQEIGLIWFEAIQGRCTYVFVKGFEKFKRALGFRAVVDSNARKKKKKEAESSEEKKSVSVIDTFLLPNNVSRTLTSTVDVSQPVSKGKKVLSAETKAALDKIIGR